MIDTSGSMEREDRLGLVKQSLELLVGALRPTDTIGIVTYVLQRAPVIGGGFGYNPWYGLLAAIVLGGGTFAVLFVAWLLVSILGFLFNLPSMVLIFAGSLHGAGPDGALGVAAVAAGALATLSSALLYPIPLVAAGLQYFSLVEEKERVGLMERIDALQGPEQDAFWQEEPPKP